MMNALKRNMLIGCILIYICFTCISNNIAKAALPGDTTFVQTFTFGSALDDWFLFPSDTESFEKILMYYTLKCNPAQSPACGEWDYLTYSYLYDHTGVMDSNLLSHPNFIVNGTTPDTFRFMHQPSWKYFPYYQYSINYIDTLSFDSAIVGNGVVVSGQTFHTNISDGKSQYLWRASELSAAGLTAGPVTGLRFDIQSVGSEMQHLSIKIKHTTLDSLVVENYEDVGFTTVFSGNKLFSSTGWQYFHFTDTFTWIDSLNILVEICFDNDSSGIDNRLNSDVTSFPAGIYATKDDHMLEFDGADHISVPASAFTSIDSFITVAFWQYGDENMQPQNDVIFEGANSSGQRVINVHLPWGNSNVYWDAGNSGSSYDRINKSTSDNNFEGRWNHWAFTKDVSTGTMQIFLNGVLFHSGTGKTRTMEDITSFTIGSSANGSNFYDGMIDEFTIWDTVLDTADIQNWMYKDINNTHPNISHLILYYQFNKGTGLTTIDSSGNGYHGQLLGLPEWLDIKGCDQFRNLSNTTWRPNVIFEQGSYNTVIDSQLLVDSVYKSQISIVIYGDTTNPTLPTDTLYKWPEYYNNFVYDTTGKAIDSTAVPSDSVMYRSDMEYYGPPYEIIDRYEIGRFITPYGIGLDLGDGFTWVYDVTDYRPLLVDSVHLSAGNWQELQDVVFVMIKGTPPRKVLSIDNIWNGSFSYKSMADNTSVLPKTVDFSGSAKMFRIKTRTTGHGFGKGENCAEFCKKTHSLQLNGVTKFNWPLWDECANNPVFPQGGTWLYDRAGWCPGKDVRTYDHEITPFVTPGSQETLDYSVEGYPPYGGYGNYKLEVQLISYSSPSFKLDGAIEDIISPSRNDLYGRMNPICREPKIVIKNKGETKLTSLAITYGVEGGRDCYYYWEGNLEFLESEEVTLPPFSWNGFSAEQQFRVEVSHPNNGVDEYENNNIMYSHFDIPPQYPGDIILRLRSNHAGSETSYTIKDEEGNVLYSRTSCANNLLYKDTFNLAPGCYEFKLMDKGDNGLDFWAINPPNGNGTSGYAIFKEVGGPTLIIFEPDFGKDIIHQFTVGYELGEGPQKDSCTPVGINDHKFNYSNELFSIYPNPSKGQFKMNILQDLQSDINITIYNLMGETVLTKKITNPTRKTYTFDISNNTAGIYIMNIVTDNEAISRRLLLLPYSDKRD